MIDLLKATNLEFSYGDRPTLRGISLSIESRETVALIGPNGSGKSTLIKSLLGHLQITNGTIEWEGTALPFWKRRELSRRIAYLPQTPVFEPGQSVGDVLRLGRAPYWGAFGLESSRDASVVRRIAEQMQLRDIMDRPIDTLSGGQRQRVLIGRCLVQEPVVLMLDEPDTFLDLRHQVELGQLLRQLSRDRGMGILWASHDLNSAAVYADRLILLREGTVAMEGAPERVMQEAVLSETYGVPLERIDRPGKPPVVLPRIGP